MNAKNKTLQITWICTCILQKTKLPYQPWKNIANNQKKTKIYVINITCNTSITKTPKCTTNYTSYFKYQNIRNGICDKLKLLSPVTKTLKTLGAVFLCYTLEIIPNLYLHVTLNNIVILGQIWQKKVQVAYKRQGKHGYGSASQSVLVQDHSQPGQQNVAEGQIYPFKLYSFQLCIPPFSPSYLCGDKELDVLSVP